jgi:hypothetical protein
MKKYLENYLGELCLFSKLHSTTNVRKYATVSIFFTRNNTISYIYSAGGQFIWQRHLWLSVAYPGKFFSSLQKDNHR